MCRNFRLKRHTYTHQLHTPATHTHTHTPATHTYTHTPATHTHTHTPATHIHTHTHIPRWAEATKNQRNSVGLPDGSPPFLKDPKQRDAPWQCYFLQIFKMLLFLFINLSHIFMYWKEWFAYVRSKKRNGNKVLGIQRWKCQQVMIWYIRRTLHY